MVGSIRRLAYALLILAAVYTVGRVLRSSLDFSATPLTSGEGHSHALQHLTSAPKQIWNDEQGRYKWIAHAKLRQLTACLARGDCHPNADKIVVFASNFCHWALAERDAIPGGEQVWCQAMRDSFERSGFTLINAGPQDHHFLLDLYREVGENIVWILGDGGQPQDGRGVFGDIVKSEQLPDGVPAWKWFQFEYSPSEMDTIVGPATWRASAEPDMAKNLTIEWRGDTAVIHTEFDNLRVWSSEGDLPGQPPTSGWSAQDASTYVGWDLDMPDDFEVVPWSERPNRIWVLGKFPRYYTSYPAWPPAFYTAAHEELSKEFEGFEFVGSIRVEDAGQDKMDDVPSVIRNVGRKSPDEFDQELKNCKGLLGIGPPVNSPTPYRALAMGVAFINPHAILDWEFEGDKEQRRNMSRWDDGQHITMKGMPEPWVYQAERAVYDDFVGAIRKALSTQTRPARFARMSRGVYDRRLADIALRDWRQEVEIALERGIGRKGLLL
ncbi:Alpha-1,6-mannosylglycoprotein 6-beta-N-acetylglucosaminyltransferase B [Vanrija pseudolonga]|uniref:Alpha-1,6-mannosylglycoprotein 6-beta-N-acetylglucosaminyltransferase B n=1 Tax=Vanrija pseudolonga TaxID=143232 RepID=A0AAF1BQH3_9TREE|nr:Alpha-1,6-mannosylglycoprotein 6-beta-N-acetylglucosaminyltransferase B [Vanrija pseudolonga]